MGDGLLPMFWIAVLLVACALVAGFLVVNTGRFRAKVREIESQLLATPLPAPAKAGGLPETVRAVAERAGAGHGGLARAIRLEQQAEMQLGEAKPWQRYAARQVIAVGDAGFAWFAWQKPLPILSVLDAFVAGRGWLCARLVGGIPLVDARGDDLNLGEAMRYLAELPWAPDAILANPAIGWLVARDGWLEARLPIAGQTALVRLLPDARGDLVEITATGRPARRPDGSTALMDWRGVFSHHRDIGGRRIPLAGEVGYVEHGDYRPYWRGRITRYELVR